MATSNSYKTIGLVIKKTKLAETDLIVTLLNEDGNQVRTVVKGARKPGSRLGGATELYSYSELTLSCGKSLDIVTDARLLKANRNCVADLEHATAAAIIVELLEKISRDSEGDKRLLPLALASLTALADVNSMATSAHLEFLLATACLKIVAQIGLRPELDQCVGCGSDIKGIAAYFSSRDGGVICTHCSPMSDAGVQVFSESDLAWLKIALYSRFSELDIMLNELSQTGKSNANVAALAALLLPIAEDMIVIHLNIRLKSLQFFYKQLQLR